MERAKGGINAYSWCVVTGDICSSNAQLLESSERSSDDISASTYVVPESYAPIPAREKKDGGYLLPT